MLILSHPTGNANVRAVAQGFVRANALYKFYTTLASFPNTFLDKAGGIKALSEIRRRGFDQALRPFTNTLPWRELARLIAAKAKIQSLVNDETASLSVDSVYRSFDAHVASHLSSAVEQGVTGVYCYEDGALSTFRQAENLGLKRIYDLPIAYWETMRKLMTEEAERLPAWTAALGGGINDSPAKLKRKTQEIELADLIIVPSGFVKDSLPSFVNQEKVVVSFFGSPASGRNTTFESPGETPHNRRLRVLFVGSMGQRKGLRDLFAAAKLLGKNSIELVVMGSPLAPLEFYKKEFSDFTHEPGRPHREVLKLMRSCDVFCLPSIVEGRALVMQEAMSQGLPLIITANTGGADLIVPGKTGFLVPIRSPEAIAEKLNWFVENKAALPEMRRLSQIHAAGYTWEAYAEKIVGSASQLFD